MRRTVRIRLLTIFITALIATALHSTATAQTSSALDSRATALASSGEPRIAPNSSALDDVCEQRLLKALDALDKAEKALGYALGEIEARKRLDDLKTDLLKAKDQYIADILADNDFLRKQVHPSKSTLRKFFEKVEKILILAAGIYIGGGL